MKNRHIIIAFLILISILSLYYGSLQKSNKLKENFTNTNTNTKTNKNKTESVYTAIIVEPRKHAALELVLSNFTSVLDERWEFIVFHGNKNEEYVKNIVKSIKNNNQKQKQNIRLVNLNVDNLSIPDYNALFYDKHKIYDHITTETFLVFQTDTLISEKYKDLVYDFIEYDYVGAPWSFNNEVGNGGLSLRKKTKMLEILDKGPTVPDPSVNEDMFFALPTNNVKMIKPDFNSALNFSIETVYNPKNKSFGIHKPWAYLDREKINKISEYIPQINELITKQRTE